jgi:hypothetical protein
MHIWLTIRGGAPILIHFTSTRLCAERGLVDRVREATAGIFLYNSLRCVVRHRFLNLYPWVGQRCYLVNRPQALAVGCVLEARNMYMGIGSLSICFV